MENSIWCKLHALCNSVMAEIRFVLKHELTLHKFSFIVTADHDTIINEIRQLAVFAELIMD